jgi:hypothetical protein
MEEALLFALVVGSLMFELYALAILTVEDVKNEDVGHDLTCFLI